MAEHSPRLSLTRRANRFLRAGMQAGVLTVEARKVIIERANEIARARNAKTIGDAAIRQALREFRKSDV